MTAAKRTVAEAWAAVMADVQAVGKTGHNSSQNYNFRGIDGVIDAVGPAMRTHGVFVIPSVREANYRDVEVGKNRTLMREVTVKVKYVIIGPAGDPLVVPEIPEFGDVVGESMDSGDKGTAKAMSVAYRIFLLQALSIPTHSGDPDESSYERATAAVSWNKNVAKQHLVAKLGKDEAARAWTHLELDQIEEWSEQLADSYVAAWQADSGEAA